MDPDANIAEQLSIAKAIDAINDNGGDEWTEGELESLAHHATRLAELINGLAHWHGLSNSGIPLATSEND